MNKVIMSMLTQGSDCVLQNEEDLRSDNPTSFTAIIKGVDEVCALVGGEIKFVGSTDSSGSVSVAINDNEILRYAYLSEPYGKFGDEVSVEQPVGRAKNSILKFEYCTRWQGTSEFPIRIDNQLYYKQNPIDILDNVYEVINEIDVYEDYNRPQDTLEFTDEQLEEWYSFPKPTGSLAHLIQVDPSAHMIDDVLNLPESYYNETDNQ